jgi:hypothetical protein
MKNWETPYTLGHETWISNDFLLLFLVAENYSSSLRFHLFIWKMGHRKIALCGDI